MDLKRKRLSLKEKVKVIEVAETEKLSLRQLAERYGISKNQVSNVLKCKEEIKRLWISNANEDSKTVKFRKTESCEIDSAVFNWFSSIRARNIPVSGLLIQEQARKVAESLGIAEFKASNGWLEKFQKRHNISFKMICGEKNSVDIQTVTEWKEKLIEICKGYEPRNILNADETGLFFRVLPNKTMSFKGEKCSGGKSSKERLTVLLCCNVEGDFEMPLVIGKSRKPRCFKSINLNSLKVQWESNKKAWMSSDIMTKWLIALDEKMRKAGRKILLFMDNATSHPQNIKLGSIKVVFFPPNTTAVLQPLDQGVIRSFKLSYRGLFLRHILSMASSCENSDQLAKSVNVLNAVQWIRSAINSVSQDCVKKCFEKAGFVVTVPIKRNLNLIEESKDLSQLIKDNGSNVTVEEYILIDDELQTEDSNTDVEMFITETGTTANSEEESDEGEIEEPENCDIKSLSHALKYARELQKFLIDVGDSEGLLLTSKLNIHLEKNAYKLKNMKQTCLTDYFK